MKILICVALLCVSGCSWFHRKTPPPPPPPELIITGATAGSIILIDGAPAGQPLDVSDRPHELDVSAGEHRVSIRVGDKIVYQEEIYVVAGEKRVVTVLSGITHP